MVAKKMGASQAPVCEAFIMTGETILKTYTNNKSENGSIKKTVRAADTTTPGLLKRAPRDTIDSEGDTITTSASESRTNGTNSITTTTSTSTTASTKVPEPTRATGASTNCESSNADYIRHAQYRVAAALEQRAKSQSLNELSSNQVSCFRRLSPAAAAANENSAGCEPDGRQEEASARVRAPDFLHEQQQQHQQQRLVKYEREQEKQPEPQQQQPQQQQRRRPAPLPLQEQQPQPQLQAQLQQQPKAQQRHLHENARGGQNSEKSTKPSNGLADRNSRTKQPKDCEYSTSTATANQKKVDFLDSKKQRAQQKPMDKPQPTPVTRTATFIVTSKRPIKKERNKLNGVAANGQPRFEADDFSIEFKRGFLNRKRTFEPKGRPTAKGQRGWRRVYVILRDLRFILRYGQNEFELAHQKGEENNESTTGGGAAAHKKMEEQTAAKNRKQLAAKDLKNTIRLHHAFAKRSTSYTKREYVFNLVLADQSELLLQAQSEDEMVSWIDTINFASACLSSAPLPFSVSSSKRYHQHDKSRPILPASYTKLSYWEQLTDHEQRLERLKTELEEHLAEAPVKRTANRRSKSEFIDKIAYLRETIEHYTVYLDLMQKKSNSSEAIVLSKHPQIASLTPSKEMIRSLPLVGAKVPESEDKKEAA